MLGEVAVAVVQKNRVRPAGRQQDQVERAVAVHVGERGAAGVPVARADARRFGDVLELPVAEVLVERAAALRLGEKDVQEAVAVHVAERDAGALPENTVAEQQRIADVILEADARLVRGHRGEPRVPARHDEVAPAIAGLLMPRRRRRRAACASGRGQAERHARGRASVHRRDVEQPSNAATSAIQDRRRVCREPSRRPRRAVSESSRSPASAAFRRGRKRRRSPPRRTAPEFQ